MAFEFEQIPKLLDDIQADRLLTSEQAANRLGVSVRQLRQWLSEDLLPHEKVGGRLVFRPLALLRWLATGQQTLAAEESDRMNDERT